VWTYFILKITLGPADEKCLREVKHYMFEYLWVWNDKFEALTIRIFFWATVSVCDSYLAQWDDREALVQGRSLEELVLSSARETVLTSCVQWRTMAYTNIHNLWSNHRGPAKHAPHQTLSIQTVIDLVMFKCVCGSWA